MRYGVVSQSTSLLRNDRKVTMEHLSFLCDFSKHVWRSIMETCNHQYRNQLWGNYISQLSRKWKGDSLINLIRKLCLGATVYEIWRERNKRSFSNESRDKDVIVAKIKKMVRDKAFELTKVQDSSENRRCAGRWCLPNYIFGEDQLGQCVWFWAACL